MTNNVAVMLGTVLTAALLPGADDLAQLTLTPCIDISCHKEGTI
jgi:hypothetical protein